MSWTTVALIALAVIVLIVVIQAGVALFFGASFRRQWKEDKDEFERRWNDRR